MNNEKQYYKFLKKLLFDYRLTSNRIKDLYGYNSFPSIMNKLKNGETKTMHPESLKTLENILNIKIDDSNPDNITYKKNESMQNEIPSEIKEKDEKAQLWPYPISEQINAVNGIFNSQNNNKVIYMNFKPNGHRLYAVKVDSKVMDTIIVDNSIILIDADENITNNCVVAAKTNNGRQYIKRYQEINKELIKLYPDNKEDESIVIKKEEIISIYKVIQAMTDLR